MPVQAVIYDAENNKSAKIVNGGALAVLPPKYNQIFNAKLDVNNQVYNIVPALADNFFVGQVLILSANKNVGVNDATVNIYAGDSEDAVYVSGTEFLTLELSSKSNIVIQDMNLITLNKGIWINATTDDDDVYVTLLGYYTKG